MADRIKNYEIQYNILSNATQAAEGFASLLGYVEKLSGKDPGTGMARGLTKISGEINQVVKDTTRLKTAFAEIRPEIDMSGFKSQIGQMQRAVAEFAQQTRNIMRMAMSGTDKQFAKARGAMSGSIFDAASLRWFEDELKKMPQRINDATNAVTDAQNKYNAAINAQRSYPVGATVQQIKDIDDAANREQKSLLANLNSRQRTLKSLQEQQENYTRQAQNLRSTLSEEAMRPVPGPATVTVPRGITKATDLIPKWQQEYEKARALALVKRAELEKTIGQPIKVEKPTWYGARSPFGTTYDAYMRDYDAAAKKYAATQSIAQQKIMNESRTMLASRSAKKIRPPTFPSTPPMLIACNSDFPFASGIIANIASRMPIRPSPAKRTSAQAVPSGNGRIPCSSTISAVRSGTIKMIPSNAAQREIIERTAAGIEVEIVSPIRSPK